MNGVLLALPDHLRRRLATALDTGLLDARCDEDAVRTCLGVAEVNGVAMALGRLAELGLSARGCAAWIRALDEAIAGLPRVDLVWTGPEVPGLHARDTRRVYEELLESAERSVWISSYAFFDGPRAFEVLARRMDSMPALRVYLLLNIRRGRGDRSKPDEIVRRFADRFWKADWPGRSRPSLFYDPRSLEVDGPTGVLHAKAVVSDEETVFVTSANFTEAAWDRNVELGLLSRDRTLALSVISHFRRLIDRALVHPLPQ